MTEEDVKNASKLIDEIHRLDKYINAEHYSDLVVFAFQDSEFKKIVNDAALTTIKKRRDQAMAKLNDLNVELNAH